MLAFAPLPHSAAAETQNLEISKYQNFKISKFQNTGIFSRRAKGGGKFSKFQNFKISKFGPIQNFKVLKFQSFKFPTPSKFQSFKVSKFQICGPASSLSLKLRVKLGGQNLGRHNVSSKKKKGEKSAFSAQK